MSGIFFLDDLTDAQLTRSNRPKRSPRRLERAQEQNESSDCRNDEGQGGGPDVGGSVRPEAGDAIDVNKCESDACGCDQKARARSNPKKEFAADAMR